MPKSFITTSIAYINAAPHIGFLLELVAADVIARQARLRGKEVFFLTGTDEHGLKIQQAAQTAGQEPQQFADEMTESFRALCRDFDISNDYFVRTTDPQHVAFIQETWRQLAKAGAFEKRAYTGWYCTGCEAFKTEREIAEGKCLIHEQPVEKVEEENWFLPIPPAVKEQIRAWLPAVFPESKQNEVANILNDFHEVSVSRPKEKLQWGIPVPDDETQTMYVWIDALFNYLSGIQLSGRSIADWWPAQTQIVGKDILKFHAIIWPALLLALGYELPKKLLVHGFVNVEGKKMSKSLGNVITPEQLKVRYGVDGTRYLLLRQLNFYDDSNFSWAEFDALYNGELANGLGNLLARTIGLATKAKLSITEVQTPPELAVFPDFQFDLTAANELIKGADKIITENKLWVDPHLKEAELQQVVTLIQEAAYRLQPYMPETAKRINTQLQTLQSEPLFPRLS